MSQNGYEKIEGPRAEKLLDRLNPVWAGSPFETGKAVIHARGLPFAKGWVLAEVEDNLAMPGKKCVALDNGRDCIPVEYNAQFIPAFIKNHALSLTEKTAKSYLHFWFEYARSGVERFILIENLDDVPWREEITPQIQRSLSKRVTPVTLVETTPKGFTFEATILFRDTLMIVAATVTPDGDVKLDKKETVVQNLTVTDALVGF